MHWHTRVHYICIVFICLSWSSASKEPFVALVLEVFALVLKEPFVALVLEVFLLYQKNHLWHWYLKFLPLYQKNHLWHWYMGKLTFPIFSIKRTICGIVAWSIPLVPKEPFVALVHGVLNLLFMSFSIKRTICGIVAWSSFLLYQKNHLWHWYLRY